MRRAITVTFCRGSYFLGAKLVDQITKRIDTLETQLGSRLDGLRQDVRDLANRVRDLEKVRQ